MDSSALLGHGACLSGHRGEVPIFQCENGSVTQRAGSLNLVARNSLYGHLLDGHALDSAGAWTCYQKRNHSLTFRRRTFYEPYGLLEYYWNMAWSPPESAGAALTCPWRYGFAEQCSHGSLSKPSGLRYSRSNRKQGTSERRASHFVVHFKATKWHNGHCTINVSHILVRGACRIRR